MAAWFRPALTAAGLARVASDIAGHPDAAVRRKMLALRAVHLGHTREQAARIAGVATPELYLLAFRDGGSDGLVRCDWHVPVSGLAAHAEAVRASLAERPVRTAAEAAGRIEEVTGLRRGLTQTRAFPASLGFEWQSVRAVPVPVPPKRPCPNTPKPGGPSGNPNSNPPSTRPGRGKATSSSPTPPTSSTAPT